MSALRIAIATLALRRVLAQAHMRCLSFMFSCHAIEAHKIMCIMVAIVTVYRIFSPGSHPSAVRSLSSTCIEVHQVFSAHGNHLVEPPIKFHHVALVACIN